MPSRWCATGPVCTDGDCAGGRLPERHRCAETRWNEGAIHRISIVLWAEVLQNTIEVNQQRFRPVQTVPILLQLRFQNRLAY